MEFKNLDPVKTGKFIEELRKSNNLTQGEFGEKLYVTRKAVSKWETGRSVPSIDMIKKISEIFDVSIDEIISGEMKTKRDEKEKKKNKRNYRLIIQSIFIVLFVILLIYFVNNYGKVHIYEMYSDECRISGMYIVTSERRTFALNGIFVDNSKIDEIMGTDFGFRIESGDKYIFGRENKSEFGEISSIIKLKDYIEDIQVLLENDIPKIEKPENATYTLTIEYTDQDSNKQRYTVHFKMWEQYANDRFFYEKYEM